MKYSRNAEKKESHHAVFMYILLSSIKLYLYNLIECCATIFSR